MRGEGPRGDFVLRGFWDRGGLLGRGDLERGFEWGELCLGNDFEFTGFEGAFEVGFGGVWHFIGDA